MALLGLAGPAEAGIAVAQGLMCIGVFLTGVTALFGLLLRSRVAAAFGAVVGSLNTLLFLPWQAFWPEPSDDPDVQDFQASFRTLAWWWMPSAVLAVAAFIRVFGFPATPASPADPPEGPGTAWAVPAPRVWIAWLVAFCLGVLLMLLVAVPQK